MAKSKTGKAPKLVQPDKEVAKVPKLDKSAMEEGLVGNVPKGKVKKADFEKYPPDTIEEYVPVANTRGNKVWVKDASLLKSIEGTNQTLAGTEYLGELLQK